MSYESLATDLLNYTEQTLPNLTGARRLEVAPQLAERAGKMGEQPALIRGWAWESPVLARMRVALLLAGSRTAVFSALALPWPRYELPLFAAEVVVINGLVTVVAFDWIPLFAGASYTAALAQIRVNMEHFPPGGALPEWAADSFSPYALFSRLRDALPASDIAQAYAAYLAPYLALCRAAAPSGDPSQTRAAQTEYCRRHFANDPGANMLAKIFGSAWSAEYARDFLFRTAAS